MSGGICFCCGRKLTKDGQGAPVFAERDHFGAEVRMHKNCAAGYDRNREEDAITARERKDQ